ncbi:hypothetical protein OROGR_010810 [Orobanche gracilis]
MATNVFGNPVTDDTVRLVYPNLTQITALDRAGVALQYMNADDRATNVSRSVHNLKEAYGNGTSTLCMVFNATGGNLHFDRHHSWEGSVWRSPFPDIIQNGQWAGFLFVRDRLMGPSKGAIVYRGENNDGIGRDWMLAWNTSRMDWQNRVYTEIRAAGSFNSANWNTINNSMEAQTNNHSTTSLGCFASGSIGSGSSPEFVGRMSLAGLRSDLAAIASDVSVISESLDSKYKDDVGEGDEGEDGAVPAVPAA